MHSDNRLYENKKAASACTFYANTVYAYFGNASVSLLSFLLLARVCACSCACGALHVLGRSGRVLCCVALGGRVRNQAISQQRGHAHGRSVSASAQ